MQTADTRFEAELLKRIDAEIAALSDALAGGAAVDYADYRNRCGEITGLRNVAELAEETNKLIQER